MNFFPPFIGINEKFINLNSIAVIEDQSTDIEPKAVIVTTDGQEIELINEDAELLFERCELVSFASDRVFDTLQQQFNAAGAAQTVGRDKDEDMAGG